MQARSQGKTRLNERQTLSFGNRLITLRKQLIMCVRSISNVADADDHAEVDQRYSTCGSYAAATQVKLTFAESLALMDRFVLMNRVMSIVSTCVIFAGVGLALNVVVENF